jgi:predicted phage-related endonuclease
MSIDAKVKELRELRRMAEELNGEIEAIQDSIKGQMDAQGVDELAGTDWKITWKRVTSTRLDAAALKKVLPDVAESFTKTTVTRRFCIA